MEKTIQVDNIKCGGCANSIKRKLSGMEGVSSVKVDLESSSVTVHIETESQLAPVLKALRSMGYPGSGTSGLMDSAKSYVSCMVGRITSQEDE